MSIDLEESDVHRVDSSHLCLNSSNEKYKSEGVMTEMSISVEENRFFIKVK